MKIQLTKEQQQYLVAGVVAFGALGFVYVRFFWLPLSQAKEEMTQKIAEIEAKIDKAKKQAARLNRLQEELNVLNEQAVEAEKRLPKTKSVPDILVTISKLAQQHGVQLVTFTPGSMKPQQYFIELNYPVTVRGTYHNVGRFLAGVALEQRIFNVVNVVYPGSAGGGEMAVTFTLVSYQYKG